MDTSPPTKVILLELVTCTGSLEHSHIHHSCQGPPVHQGSPVQPKMLFHDAADGECLAAKTAAQDQFGSGVGQLDRWVGYPMIVGSDSDFPYRQPCNMV